MPEGMSVKQMQARLKVVAERQKRLEQDLAVAKGEAKQLREKLKAARQPAGG